MMISGVIGMNRPTASPLPSPSSRRAFAHLHTSALSSLYVSTPAVPSSSSHRTAGASAVSVASHLSMQLWTMFISPPTHHSGNSGPFSRSTIFSKSR